MTGFFEESEGVFSMTRLVMFLLTIAAMALVGAACVYLLRPNPSAAVLGTIATVLAAVVTNGIIAIVNRHPAPDAP